MTTLPTRSAILSTYRNLLREVHRQFTSKSQNGMFRSTVVQSYQKYRTCEDAERIRKLNLDAETALSFMRSNRQYKELMDRYWPTNSFTSKELTEKTANRVGLTTSPTNFLDSQFGEEVGDDGKRARIVKQD